MKIGSKAAMMSLIASTLISSQSNVLGGELRRISLADGKEGAPAPMARLADVNDFIYLIGNVPVPMIELFPAAKKPSRGTVMVCPGGGYRSLAVTHEGYNVALKLNEFGFDAAVLIYHLRADDEDRELARGIALDNARTALSLIRERGDELGLSTETIGVIGFSAGGHLAARIAKVTSSESPLDFIALFYAGQIEKDGKILEEFAPVKAPAFIYCAKNDQNIKDSIAYAEACKQKNVKYEFHSPEKGGHGFGLRVHQAAEVKDWPAKLLSFIESIE